MSKTRPELVSPAPAGALTAAEAAAPAAALEGEEFAALMRSAGVAAGAPVAVAVSGGPDSMALALLAGDWAAGAGGAKAGGGGDIHFLTFDHGLRRDSAGEARQTGKWLAARGFAHHILSWPESTAKPLSDLQASARKARYQALEAWCAAHDVKYLLLAHHLEDQAETLLMRLARGSGVDGLAAMAASAPPVTRRKTPRLLRPLLTTPKARLAATLEARGQGWIEDPSNEDRSYLRVQARELLRDMPLDGLSPARLAATARRMARVRLVLDDQTARLLDLSVTLSEAGYARLDSALLIGGPPGEAGTPHEEIVLRVLSRLVASIGGRAYPPRLEGVERLLADMKSAGFAGATLAGCLFAPLGTPGGREKNMLLVAREAGTTEDRQDITPGAAIHWDGRFEIRADMAGTVAALGEAGWLELLALWPEAKNAPVGTALPHAARLALPALRVGACIKSVPHLGYTETGFAGFTATYTPLRPLYPGGGEGAG